MYSSRMCAACGSRQPGGGGSLPQCLLRYTLLGVGLDTPLGVGLETPWPDPSSSPLGVGLETPLARPLKLPLGCGPGDPPWPDPSSSPLGVGLETPLARPLKFPIGCGSGNLQGMLGYTPPPRPARHAGIPPVNRMTDRQV